MMKSSLVVGALVLVVAAAPSTPAVAQDKPAVQATAKSPGPDGLAENAPQDRQADGTGLAAIDSAEVKDRLRERVSWFKRYREILESDVIHGRRADGRGDENEDHRFRRHVPQDPRGGRADRLEDAEFIRALLEHHEQGTEDPEADDGAGTPREVLAHLREFGARFESRVVHPRDLGMLAQVLGDRERVLRVSHHAQV